MRTNKHVNRVGNNKKLRSRGRNVPLKNRPDTDLNQVMELLHKNRVRRRLRLAGHRPTETTTKIINATFFIRNDKQIIKNKGGHVEKKILYLSVIQMLTPTFICLVWESKYIFVTREQQNCNTRSPDKIK